MGEKWLYFWDSQIFGMTLKPPGFIKAGGTYAAKIANETISITVIEFGEGLWVKARISRGEV